MGWIEKRKVDEPPHSCPLPELMSIAKEGIGAGSIWECPKCKVRYRFDGGFAGKSQWTQGYPK